MPGVKNATREQLLIAVHEFADNLNSLGPALDLSGTNSRV